VKSQRLNQFHVGKLLRVRCTGPGFTLQGWVRRALPWRGSSTSKKKKFLEKGESLRAGSKPDQTSSSPASIQHSSSLLTVPLARDFAGIFQHSSSRELDAIEEVQALDNEEIAKKGEVSRELEACLLMEEVSWRQKSRILWLKEGDKCSKFFSFHGQFSPKIQFHRLLDD
jgi:hypothetical protein